MKVLVTGSTGFIGSHVIRQLLKSNCEVVATSGHIHNASKLDWFTAVKFLEYRLGPEMSAENLFLLFGKPDALIHLAWEGLPNYYEPVHEQQLSSHNHFIKNLVENGLKKVVVAGTCLEYGLQEGCLAETMQIMPTLPYAIAKVKLFEYISSLQKKADFELNWIRLFYMYGPGQNPKSLLSQLENAIRQNQQEFNMSKGDQERDYLPVETMADYIVKITRQHKVKGIINCCSGIPLPVLTLVQNYLAIHHASLKLNTGVFQYPEYEPFSFYGDTHKLNSALAN